MATDSNGLRDETAAELNPQGDGIDYGPQPDPIPDRPADGGPKEKWAAYVVALGMHPDEVEGRTRAELIELADRFGG